MWSASALASSSTGGGGGALRSAAALGGASGAAFLVSGFSVTPRLNQPARVLQASKAKPTSALNAIMLPIGRRGSKPLASLEVVLASCKALAIRVDLIAGPNWSTAELTGGAATAAEQSFRRIALRRALRLKKWLSSLSRSLL